MTEKTIVTKQASGPDWITLIEEDSQIPDQAEQWRQLSHVQTGFRRSHCDGTALAERLSAQRPKEPGIVEQRISSNFQSSIQAGLAK
jgi:hypothetical protein